MESQVAGCGADCIVLSCTNWHAIEAIEPLQRKLGIPIISSNQAAIHMVRQAITKRLPDGGVKMSTFVAAENVIATDDVESRITSKLRRRIIPLLVLLYVVAYVDRINIGFAALTMNAALGITSAQFGLLARNLLLGLFHL